ncbi:hypothetical protein J8273_6838 [Carpediemonas membranifera]|uniref:Uncharacterized protein n=1 Tax=Carpediemonas membranifera TaxID=201153 RepID=A0A8J6DYB1_9EUKA|nr:hypothetical protein J8273_6838 [Carpediemonas membranifera]|eukprot:KAG9391884.1 hypothetical protein J8273_6838 [Carpediemonas membranifera]
MEVLKSKPIAQDENAPNQTLGEQKISNLERKVRVLRAQKAAKEARTSGPSSTDLMSEIAADYTPKQVVRKQLRIDGMLRRAPKHGADKSMRDKTRPPLKRAKSVSPPSMKPIPTSSYCSSHKAAEAAREALFELHTRQAIAASGLPDCGWGPSELPTFSQPCTTSSAPASLPTHPRPASQPTPLMGLGSFLGMDSSPSKRFALDSPMRTSLEAACKKDHLISRSRTMAEAMIQRRRL